MEPIRDNFGRVHTYLRIAITESCNLRCSYCMPPGRPTACADSELSAAEIVELASRFVGLGVTKIRLTGGEPLARTDAGDIIRGISRLPVELVLTTNGTLVHRHIDTFVSCGVRSVNVSLDSLDEQVYRRITGRNELGRVLSNIGLLTARGIKVKLNAVIMRGINCGELQRFVEFTRNHPVQFRFIEYMPFPGNRWNERRLVPYPEMTEKIKAMYGGQLIQLPSPLHETALRYRIEGHAGEIGFIAPVTRPFCGDCNRIRLSSRGELKNCLFSKTGADLGALLRSGQDTLPAITDHFKNKYFERGGQVAMHELVASASGGLRAPMVAIGG